MNIFWKKFLLGALHWYNDKRFFWCIYSTSDPFHCSPITLVVAKCWDPNPKGYFTIPRQEPVRPIDPSAWVAHTTAVRGDYPGGHRAGGMGSPSISTMTSTSSSLTSSIPESEGNDKGVLTPCGTLWRLISSLDLLILCCSLVNEAFCVICAIT